MDNHLLQKPLIVVDAGNDDAQHKDALAAHRIAIENLRMPAHLGFERLEIVLLMIVQFEMREPDHAEAELLGIEDDCAADDDAAFLEPLQATPEGRLRQADGNADIGDRQAGCP